MINLVKLYKEYNNIRKIKNGQGDDNTAGCLLNFTYFKDSYKLIAKYLSKEEAPDADPNVIKQIILLEIWTGQEIQQYFSLLKEQKKLF